MALLRRHSYQLILSITTTSVLLFQEAIGRLSHLCLTLLGWIDRDRLVTDLARVAIDEALESWGEEAEV